MNGDLGAEASFRVFLILRKHHTTGKKEDGKATKKERSLQQTEIFYSLREYRPSEFLNSR